MRRTTMTGLALMALAFSAAAAGGPFVLESAGFQVNVKTPRPAEPAREPPPG